MSWRSRRGRRHDHSVDYSSFVSESCHQAHPCSSNERRLPEGTEELPGPKGRDIIAFPVTSFQAMMEQCSVASRPLSWHVVREWNAWTIFVDFEAYMAFNTA